ncbi:MAG: hypothetical protein HGB12_06630 [Bacteroidetes bacterium]|nr:hypothetical protein [Bacteroidota bacterium]
MNSFKSLIKSLKYFFENKNYLFVFFVASAIIGVGISYSNFYLFHLSLAIYLLLYILLSPLNKFSEFYLLSKLPTRVHYIIFFTISWYILMLFISENIIYGITYLTFIIIGAITVFVVVQKIKSISDLELLFKMLAIIVVVEIFVSLLESFGLFRWPISRLSDNVIYFGRTNEITGILKESVSAFYVQTMPTGFHWNPNDLAVLLGMIFPFFLFNKNKWFAVLGNIIILWLIIQCGARIVFISCFFMLLVSCLFINRKKIIVPLITTIVILFCCSNGFSILHGKYPKFNEIQSFTYVLVGFNQPIYNEAKEDFKKGSTEVRKELIKFGINESLAHYGIGIGGGNSQYELEKTGGIGDKKIVNLHNFWIELLMEGGIIYLLVFIFWYCIVLWNLFQISRRVEHQKLKYFSKSLFVALCGFVISAIAPSTVIYFLPMYILFGFSISAINVYKLNYENTASI